MYVGVFRFFDKDWLLWLWHKMYVGGGSLCLPAKPVIDKFSNSKDVGILPQLMPGLCVSVVPYFEADDYWFLQISDPVVPRLELDVKMPSAF